MVSLYAISISAEEVLNDAVCGGVGVVAVVVVVVVEVERGGAGEVGGWRVIVVVRLGVVVEKEEA
jgi:hypothetical protein